MGSEYLEVKGETKLNDELIGRSMPGITKNTQCHHAFTVHVLAILVDLVMLLSTNGLWAEELPLK